MRKLLTLDRKCKFVRTIPISSWYNSNLPQVNWLLPFAQTHISWYSTRHYDSDNTSSHRFSWIWQYNSLRSNDHTRHHCLAIFFNNESPFCSCTYKIRATLSIGCSFCPSWILISGFFQILIRGEEDRWFCFHFLDRKLTVEEMIK
jgi:hypothetical protein